MAQFSYCEIMVFILLVAFQKLVYTLPKEDQFTPGELIGRIQEQGHSLGLVVDLTNTNRYYSSQVSQPFTFYVQTFVDFTLYVRNRNVTKYFRENNVRSEINGLRNRPKDYSQIHILFR